jgi:hypothetical protein
VPVHGAPVLEGALQDRLAHARPEVADDVADQAVTSGVVEHLADQRAGLAPVVPGRCPAASTAVPTVRDDRVFRRSKKIRRLPLV